MDPLGRADERKPWRLPPSRPGCSLALETMAATFEPAARQLEAALRFAGEPWHFATP
jgi:hypothetical protein